MKLKEIIDDTEKQDITRFILEALPEWFGISEARENYIKESAKCPFIAAYDKKRPVGFVYLKETGRDTVELFVMGVLKEYHRQGVGKALVLKAKEIATEKGYTFLQSKRFKWENTIVMIAQIISIFHLVLRNLKCFRHCGMTATHVKYMSWR